MITLVDVVVILALESISQLPLTIGFIISLAHVSLWGSLLVSVHLLSTIYDTDTPVYNIVYAVTVLFTTLTIVNITIPDVMDKTLYTGLHSAVTDIILLVSVIWLAYILASLHVYEALRELSKLTGNKLFKVSGQLLLTATIIPLIGLILYLVATIVLLVAYYTLKLPPEDTMKS